MYSRPGLGDQLSGTGQALASQGLACEVPLAGELQYRLESEDYTKSWWAWQDLNLRPRHYQ